jgi:long-chain acyl-CoA synthetase
MLSSNINVPVYPSLSAESVKYILNDCKAEICFVSNSMQLDKVLSVSKELTDLKYIISFNSTEKKADNVKIISFSSVFCDRRKLPQSKLLATVENISDGINEDDLLTIIYTSGTTGIPKGVMLTHKNLYSNLITFPPILEVTHKDVFLSYLPFSHIFERTAGYYLPFFCGAKIYFAQSIDTIGIQMLEVKPTIVITVPRLLDKMYNKLMKSAEDMPRGMRKRMFFLALNVARFDGKNKNTLKWRTADKFVFSKIREKTGGRLRLFASGGGALNKNIGEFFDGIGIKTIEGYGLTETSPVISVNRPGSIKYGTVGLPLDGVQVKIAEDGEILAKGDIVMKGYYNSPAETEEAIVNGWFHTGDIGEIDKEGYLRITDRKKSLFKSSGGKYIAPTHIEELVSDLPYVDQVIVIGNERMYVTALIVPDINELKLLARKLNLKAEFETDLFTNPELRKRIEKDINESQKSLSTYEKIRKFSLLQTPFTIEGGELTPTLKIKRKFVEEKYKHLIEKMYIKI